MIAKIFITAILVLLPGLSFAEVTITVDGNIKHQVIEGFGASTVGWSDFGNDKMGAIRPKILDAMYNQVKLTMGDIHCAPYEGYNGTWGSQSNDNADPNVFNWAGFIWGRSDYDKTLLYDIAKPMGFTNILLRGGISRRWSDTWLSTLRDSDYNLYLQEAAENAVAVLIRWRDQYGIIPEWHQLFNEPLSGNKEVSDGVTIPAAQEVVDLVKAAGARFRLEGFDKIKMVVASEETEEKSLSTAQAIMNDPIARQYVGAITYHTYPHESTYCLISNILSTSGAGNPVQSRITVRNNIRNLAKQYGCQVWMTEVIDVVGSPTKFDTLRGRAIHIHDEMLYADASSFWGMYNSYEINSDARADNEGHFVTFDQNLQTFKIRGVGYAVGHYARWITPKETYRIESASNDKLVQVTAFKDEKKKNIVLVIINNKTQDAPVSAGLSGTSLFGKISGEQSTASAFWQSIVPFSPDSQTQIKLTVPALSVTTLSCSYVNNTTGDTKTDSLINAVGYPNPFKLNGGTGSFKVANLPLDVEMKIFTAEGKLLRVLREANYGNNGWIGWDGKNDNGEDVARGVYIYSLVDANGNRKTGKIGLAK